MCANKRHNDVTTCLYAQLQYRILCHQQTQCRWSNTFRNTGITNCNPRRKILLKKAHFFEVFFFKRTFGVCRQSRTYVTPISKFLLFITSELIHARVNTCRSQWPRGLRRSSAAARLIGSWVRIPPEAWIFVCCEYYVCCQVEVSATSWSLVQRSPSDCGASLCVIYKPRELAGHGLRWAAAPKICIYRVRQENVYTL